MNTPDYGLLGAIFAIQANLNKHSAPKPDKSLEVFDYETDGEITVVYRSHNEAGRVIVDEIEGYLIGEDMTPVSAAEVDKAGFVVKIKDESDLQQVLDDYARGEAEDAARDREDQ